MTKLFKPPCGQLSTRLCNLSTYLYGHIQWSLLRINLTSFITGEQGGIYRAPDFLSNYNFGRDIENVFCLGKLHFSYILRKTKEIHPGDLQPWWCPISDSNKCPVQRQTTDVQTDRQRYVGTDKTTDLRAATNEKIFFNRLNMQKFLVKIKHSEFK